MLRAEDNDLLFRRIEAVRAFQSAGPSIGHGGPASPRAGLRAFAGLVRRTEDWRTLGMTPEARAKSPIRHAVR